VCFFSFISGEVGTSSVKIDTPYTAHGGQTNSTGRRREGGRELTALLFFLALHKQSVIPGLTFGGVALTTGKVYFNNYMALW